MFKINPLKLFVVLLALSIGLGLSVKKFLNSNYLNSYIVKKLLVVSSQNTKFNYKDFNLFVSKTHFFPTLVLQVNEVSFFVPDKCRSQLNIIAKKVLSPINILSALRHRKDIRLNVQFKNVLVERKPYQCKNNKLNNVEETPFLQLNTAESLKKYIENGIKRLPKLNYLSYKLSERLNEVHINHLEYSDHMSLEKISKLNMNFEKLKIKFDPGVINITSSANWPYHKVLGKNLQIPIFRFSVKNNNIKLKMLGKIREGHIALDASVTGKSRSVTIDIRAKQVPLGESVRLVRGVLGLNINYTSALSWLNCHLRVNGAIDDIFNKAQKISHCQVVGELGEWNLEPYNFKLASLKKQLEPVHLSIKKARIKKVINFLGIKNQFSIVNKFGLFTGEVQWLPVDESWNSTGVVKNIELIYDYKKQKHKQWVKKINVEAMGLSTGYNIRAKNFDLQNGTLKGVLDYSYDFNSTIGEFKANIDELGLGKDLQLALWGGQTNFYKGNVKGTKVNNKFKFSGKLYSKAIKNIYFSSGPYEFKFKSNTRSVGGNIVFSSLFVNDSIFNIDKINMEKIISKKTLLDLKLYKVHLDFEIDSDSTAWKLSNYKNRSVNPELVFTNFGTLSNTKLYSQLDFFTPNKSITWSWKGALSDYRLSLIKPFVGALDANLKSLAIKDVVSKTKVRKVEPKSILNGNFLERAKNILPIKGN